MTEWIKCSELMPIPERRVLAYRPSDVLGQEWIMIAAFFSESDNWNDGGEWTDDEGFGCHQKYVTCWMPLPEPPKSELL